ncbi:MAG: PKD domain-containing protein [Bacteroidales bacterium]|nr:PKD domain-containing protein [Bacteroidales bacterium]
MKKLFTLMLFVVAAVCFTGCDKDIDPKLNENGAGITDPYGNSVTPTAHFQYKQHASFTVDFTNTSSNATSYKWDFGDGTTSTSTNPSHTYASVGTKHVVMYAYNGDKSSSAYADIIMTSTIKMCNTSSNKYKIYIDGINKGNLSGGYYKEYDVNPGSHTVKVEQQDGYSLWPTVETYSRDCIAGYIYTIDFPDDPLGKSANK